MISPPSSDAPSQPSRVRHPSSLRPLLTPSDEPSHDLADRQRSRYPRVIAQNSFLTPCSVQEPSQCWEHRGRLRHLIGERGIRGPASHSRGVTLTLKLKVA